MWYAKVIKETTNFIVFYRNLKGINKSIKEKVKDGEFNTVGSIPMTCKDIILKVLEDYGYKVKIIKENFIPSYSNEKYAEIKISWE